MDQKRLFLFIAISVAILTGFQVLFPAPPPVHRPAVTQAASVVQGHTAGTPASAVPPPTHDPATPGTEPAAVPPPQNRPRVKIEAPAVVGSVDLYGARLDDLQLRHYHETVAKSSPLVRLLEPDGDPQPSYIQFGWSAGDGVKVPGDDTVWTASGGDLTDTHPVTLTWDNGQGLIFRIDLSVDKDFLFTARQSVHNAGAKPVDVWPWERVRRDYTPQTAGYSVLFEGMLGVMDMRTNELGYAAAKKDGTKHDGVAYEHTGDGGWAGFGDKYWLTALVPDQVANTRSVWTYAPVNGADRYQASYVTTQPLQAAAGADAVYDSHVFVGAKEVRLLDHYEQKDNIPLLSYAIDWGWFFFITRPFFYAIDWLNSVTGNFGVAILVFTVVVKLIFYPLAAKSYQSMGKMRLLAPKVQAARERFKDDPAKQQAAMMEVYKQEGVSPAAQMGGCLPMLIQIPVFFSLYKVILINIDMRHAPFFGWIHDLSATDPTNIFNLFGLIPFDPSQLSPFLHLGVWPVVLGLTMFFQQKLNPPAPDPAQQKMLQFMPLIFVFMMGRFPAGLVIYWCWNNTLTIAQQWYIQRGATLTKAKA
jgi:YidC/Oxa1 family membrane protein insertase